MKRSMNNEVIYKLLLYTVFCVINEQTVILGNANTNTGQCFSPDGGIDVF